MSISRASIFYDFAALRKLLPEGCRAKILHEITFEAKKRGWVGGYLVNWYLEPSQPQRVISGLKTNFNPSPRYDMQ